MLPPDVFAMRILLPAIASIALMGGLWTACAWAQQDEVEDTVVADEADARPLFERVGGFEDDSKRASEGDDLPAAGDTSDAPDGKASGTSRRTSQARYARRDPALELADPRTYRLHVVVRISAPDAAAQNIVATCPIPMEWPEQHVRLLSEQVSPRARCTEQIIPGQAAILKFQVSRVDKGETAFVDRMYEITRYRTKFTIPPDELQMPRAIPAELRDQYTGIAPGVQINDRKMIDLATMLETSSHDQGPWNTAKAFWAWTRDNVKFENGDFRGAMHAIEQRCGDCEEMSALFVGLCRLSKIPARTVWVYSHDYPEFYLVDKNGKGHWIPAQVLGPAWFGEMAEYRPILQKGDRFYDPLQKQYVRYVPQTVKGFNAKVNPKVEFHHDVISDSDINGPSYTNN